MSRAIITKFGICTDGTVDPPDPPDTNGGPNEPSGYTPFFEDQFTDSTFQKWDFVGGGRGIPVTVVNGTYARWTYETGMLGGASPSALRCRDAARSHGPYSYQYHRNIRLSSNFHGHQSGINKYLYHMDGTGGAGPYVYWGGNNENDLRVEILLQRVINYAVVRHGPFSADNLFSPTAEEAAVPRDVPFDLETLWYPGTGAADGFIKVWKDGVPIYWFANLQLSASDIDATDPVNDAVQGWEIDPVWGGTDDVVPAEFTMDVDSIYVSYGSTT